MASALKHRWAVTHNYLAGITSGAWRRLLAENHFTIAPVYWHRAAFITLTSLLNSWYAGLERGRYETAVRTTKIERPPLFILGHWRSGTTHLHYLLAQDTEQFAFPNTYQVVNPETFLTTETVHKRRFAKLVPSKRPMDNMALSFDTPQEDEFGPCLTSLLSPYLGISFPRREEHYLKYLSFDQATESERKEWTRAFVWFLKKLTYHCNHVLLLKSPTHTARIRLLLQIFPEARFVHVYRNPYRVFQSTCHYFDTAMWYTYLQKPNLNEVESGILRRYSLLHDSFFRDRDLIPAGQYCEVKFEDLLRHPVAEVNRIYDHLRLPGFKQLEAKLAGYVASLKGYEQNRFPDLTAESRRLIAKAWERSFDAWEYPTEL